MGDLVYEPPRDGPTLWEMGIPDRSAAEFFVPDPDALYINRLYVHHPDRSALGHHMILILTKDGFHPMVYKTVALLFCKSAWPKQFHNVARFRQYGLWSRYGELYPEKDLVYTIGVSDHTKDWFFAQVPRCNSTNLRSFLAVFASLISISSEEKESVIKLIGQKRLKKERNMLNWCHASWFLRLCKRIEKQV